MSRIIGKQAELVAEKFLIRKGLTLIERNYLCRMGEIDLIMFDQMDLVFIEVRHRKSDTFGGAIASITESKQKKIIRTAQHYLLSSQIEYDCDYRFDVVTFEGSLKRIDWIKNAFLEPNY